MSQQLVVGNKSFFERNTVFESLCTKFEKLETKQKIFS